MKRAVYSTHTCFICKKTWQEKRYRQQDFCAECKDSPEYAIAYNLTIHLRRAINHGLPATATLEDWQQAIQHFGGMCAYCQKRPYTCLEHYIAIELGGGTTRDNILPACNYCNWRKGNIHPHSRFLAKVRQRIEDYLYTQINVA